MQKNGRLNFNQVSTFPYTQVDYNSLTSAFNCMKFHEIPGLKTHTQCQKVRNLKMDWDLLDKQAYWYT